MVKPRIFFLVVDIAERERLELKAMKAGFRICRRMSVALDILIVAEGSDNSVSGGLKFKNLIELSRDNSIRFLNFNPPETELSDPSATIKMSRATLILRQIRKPAFIALSSRRSRSAMSTTKKKIRGLTINNKSHKTILAMH